MTVNSVLLKQACTFFIFLFQSLFFLSDSIIHATMRKHHQALSFRSLGPHTTQEMYKYTLHSHQIREEQKKKQNKNGCFQYMIDPIRIH